jgi:hypothetical protein
MHLILIALPHFPPVLLACGISFHLFAHRQRGNDARWRKRAEVFLIVPKTAVTLEFRISDLSKRVGLGKPVPHLQPEKKNERDHQSHL